MKRTVWLIVFGVLVFAGLIIARLPASWVMPGPRSGVVCSEVAGSIWSGTCSGLAVQGQNIGETSWDLHVLRLLVGRINADLVVTRPQGTAQGNVEVGSDGILTAHNIKADLQLDQGLAATLPPNLQTLRGKLHADLAFARVDSRGVVRAVEGVVELHDMTDSAGGTLAQWGSYSLTFPTATTNDPVGKLQDIGRGPLAVTGSMTLTSSPPGLTVQGLVAPRSDASPDLVQEMRMLGSPDEQGRRPFSFEMTF